MGRYGEIWGDMGSSHLAQEEGELGVLLGRRLILQLRCAVLDCEGAGVARCQERRSHLGTARELTDGSGRAGHAFGAPRWDAFEAGAEGQ